MTANKKKSKKRDKWLFLIAIQKWLTGIFLLLLGIGALNLIGKDLAATLEKGIELLNADPENYYFHWLMNKVAGVDKTKLEWLSAGTFVYAALSLAEGIGLILKERWGEWLTLIATASFLPIEIYELIKKFNGLKTVVLAINIAAVIYIIFRLKTDKAKAAK